MMNARKRKKLQNMDFTINGDPADPVENFCVDEKVFFHIKKKYKPTKLIGEGTHGGKVCSAKYLEEHGRIVAIKKTPVSFSNTKIFEALQVSREIIMLSYLNSGPRISHPCIVRLIDIMIPVTPENQESKKFDEVYIVYGYMDCDLDQVIKASKELQDPKNIMSYFTQMLKAVEYMHSCKVIHRDLKPKNILVDSQHNTLQICDFGWSCLMKEGHTSKFNVGTKYYRAPELVLESKYTTAVDMWSLGCIFGEILLGKSMFDKGENEDELKAIISVMGIPSPEDLFFIDNYEKRELVQELLADFVSGPSIPPLAQRFPHVNGSAIVLLESMLSFDPTKRITAAECLNNDFIAATSEKWDQIFASKMVKSPLNDPFTEKPPNWKDDTTDPGTLRSIFWKASEDMKRENPKVYHDLLIGCSLQFTST